MGPRRGRLRGGPLRADVRAGDGETRRRRGRHERRRPQRRGDARRATAGPPELGVEGVRERADAELEAGHVNWHDEVPPVMVSPRGEVARAFRVAVRNEGGDPRLLRKTGTSDMNVYAAWDVPMATYGPGDSDLDHAPDERLSLPELDRAVAVLEGVVERL
ncbi:M20/M25/M40 family metallo-hydrolase [Halosegnis marinus]|uniref:M20/M25/M40 family metallo-hydrolase n=1 Tax=Halosegnis marinus TaxID=3034023 RepID=UPI00360FEDEA